MITRRDSIKALMAGAGLVVLPGRSRAGSNMDELAAASPWSMGLGARMRLVRGTPLGRGDGYAAAIQIALDGGYRTYWRMPGDAGVPPIFDWSRSRNLASIAPAWPVPRRFDEAGISVIGYDGGNLVLPLRIAATDPAAPVGLELSLDFAACKKICVPEKGEAALTLRADGPEGLYAALIEAAAREVPKRIEASALGLDRTDAAHLTLAPDRHGLVLRPQLEDGEQVIDVFVEGPAQWLFGVPVAGNGSRAEIALPLLDKPKRIDRAADIPFTLTILTALRAVETMIAVRAVG
jgi:DsbC/DsbD-like thiol-disulfide interchange protein